MHFTTRTIGPGAQEDQARRFRSCLANWRIDGVHGRCQTGAILALLVAAVRQDCLSLIC